MVKADNVDYVTIIDNSVAKRQSLYSYDFELTKGIVMFFRKNKIKVENDNRLNIVMAIIFLFVGAILFKLFNLQVTKYDLFVVFKYDSFLFVYPVHFIPGQKPGTFAFFKLIFIQYSDGAICCNPDIYNQIKIGNPVI